MSTVHVEGSLFIKCRTGRHGPFNVGSLECPLGSFTVKNTLIDQFEEGRFDGTFEIAEIFMAQRPFGDSAAITELRARVLNITLFDEGDLPPDQAVGIEDQDPIDEETNVSSKTVPPAEEEAASTQEPSPTEHQKEVVASLLTRPVRTKRTTDRAEEQQAEPDKLFGHLWPIGEEVKLDATVDRQVFRRQKDYLKAAGYRFDITDQTWKVSKLENA